MYEYHMVIGDPHAKPGVNNNRFLWAGRMAVDRQPPLIICMGDFADMPSICSYDRGTKNWQGRSFAADVAACHDALHKFNTPIIEYNAIRKAQRRAQYKPRMIMLGGNHDEARIERVIQSHPDLFGTISLEDLQYKEHGWEYSPYRAFIEVDGITYSHNFASGIKGDAISGMNVAQSLLSKLMVSCSVGHNHLLDWAVRTSPNGKKTMALSAGCYFEHSEDYAKATQHMWWRGICMKHMIASGVYDLETVSMSEIKKLYA